jgi:hypothetical protein
MSTLKKIGLAASGLVAVVVSSTASAIDTTVVGTAITAAETDALTTGQFVIGTVASLVVVGLIVGLVKKL